MPLSMLMMAGCSHKATTDAVKGPLVATATKGIETDRGLRNSKPKQARPSVIVYRMSGDYADLVPVTLDGDGNIVSYPDPTDITEHSRPVALGDGWYLDRRGVSERSAFTDYTYAQYHALEQVPGLGTLQSHIVARHAIVDIWDCGKSERSIAELQQLVKDGFPGCRKVYGAPTIVMP